MPRPAFLYDDAYITLQNALAIWNGGDPHYPHASILSGATSPFHLLLVTALLAVLPPEWALLASCLAGTAAYAAGVWALARAEGLRRMDSAALVCVGLGVGMLSQHLVNGLETSWALAGVTWAVRNGRVGSPRSLAIVCATLPFIRPELVVIGAALLIYRVHAKRHEASALALPFLAVLLPWLALMVVITGGMVPTTLAAKRDWFAEGCWPLDRRATVVGTGIWLWLRACAFLSLGLIGLARTATGRMLAGAAFLTILVWATQVPDVLHAYQRHRYYAPFVPLLLFGTLMLPQAIRRLVIGGAAIWAIVTTAAVIRLEPAAIANAHRLRQQVAVTLESRRAHTVMVHDAGYLAFANAAPILVDMVGLKTPAAAELHHQFTGPTCGDRRGEAVRVVALQTRPDHLVIWEPWDDFFRVSESLRRGGWRAEKVASFGKTEPIAIFALSPPAVSLTGGQSTARERQ